MPVPHNKPSGVAVVLGGKPVIETLVSSRDRGVG